MNREFFLDLSITEQIKFYNDGLSKGMSLSSISREIGISKSISEKFKKNGYVLVDNQLVKSNDITINETTATATKSDLVDTKTVSSNIGNSNSNSSITPKKANKGRPKTQNDSKQHSIVIDNDLWKELRIYAIKNDTEASLVIEELVKNFLKNN